MRNTYMKHVWNMFELQHARVYIYTLLHDRVLQGWGITCHPKSIVRNVCRRQILFLKVIQQGDLAMPRWLIFRLPATRFSSGPSFPKNWPNLNGKGEKIFEVPWKMSRTWYNTICSHTEKKLERWLNHHASDRHDVTSIIQQLTTWPFVGSSRPVCCENTTYRMDGWQICLFLIENQLPWCNAEKVCSGY